MLDDITKRRINTLRQILVGKLPDPKAQVEQITNGLIYKFMNDMDEQSVSIGGKSTYFSGKFQKYSWKNLLDTKTSGVEKVALYSEAIEQMYNNENLPELFREIFKNSFLPFKDPSTLNMFLKEINEFNYSHSEKLGDAFEYLLSFMGSQGDAGQFRTPRHIIDFIVEIVNPQKKETILDPACGTAGFLISSYKHILKQNTKKNSGDLLNTSDRKKIGENLNGYDISPDMVKMSLVNMYLHKFTSPNISEYDTLSSEDKWNEYYDVIIANPPFFSPKGGITPHNRFGVRSTKAEVLFVDYINEHLKPNGRAGIIVPDGIINQKGTAYKQLRKKLIETSLIGVISLPTGVFQPYSGVKTAVLILDKEKNKIKKEVFFINVKNDGYDLTANRKKIEENDLPNIIKLINNDENSKLELVKKEDILKNDCSLNYSSYKNDEIIKSDFKLVLLKEHTELKRGTSITKKDVTHGDIPVIAGGQKPAYFHNTSNRKSHCITVSSSGAYAGYVDFHKKPIFASDCFTIETNNVDLNQKFLFYLLKSKQELIYSFQTGGGQPHVYAKDFDKFKIPLPTIQTQNQIVEELDSYQKIIDGCNQILNNYKPNFNIKTNWQKKKLKDFATLNYGLGEAAIEKGKYRFVRITDINEKGLLKETDKKYININDENKKYILNKEDVLVARTGATYGKCLFFESDEPSVYAGYLIRLNFDKNILLPKFFWIFSQSENFSQQKKRLVIGGGQPQFNANTLGEVIVPIPSSDEQNEIINKILDEQKVIYGNFDLINKFKQKQKEKMDLIWST